jgi:acyl-CoA thioester hydrolase
LSEDGGDGGRWPDIAGRMGKDATGRFHRLPVRVYFEDTDAGGVVYHASYVRFCERGRTDFLRLLGVEARQLISGEASNEPAAFVVRRMSLEFLRPARMDDLLVVETRVKELRGASVTLMQSVWKDDRKVFEAEVVVVLLSVAGKLLRLSRSIRVAFGDQ